MIRQIDDDGHYNSAGTHSTGIWLAFLAQSREASVYSMHGGAPECAFIALNGSSTHCHAYRRNPDAEMHQRRPMVSA